MRRRQVRLLDAKTRAGRRPSQKSEASIGVAHLGILVDAFDGIRHAEILVQHADAVQGVVGVLAERDLSPISGRRRCRLPTHARANFRELAARRRSARPSRAGIEHARRGLEDGDRDVGRPLFAFAARDRQSRRETANAAARDRDPDLVGRGSPVRSHRRASSLDVSKCRAKGVDGTEMTTRRGAS